MHWISCITLCTAAAQDVVPATDVNDGRRRQTKPDSLPLAVSVADGCGIKDKPVPDSPEAALDWLHIIAYEWPKLQGRRLWFGVIVERPTLIEG